MKISVASDHRGFDLKSHIVAMLQQAGHEVIDEGPNDAKSVDYPDFAGKVSQKVSRQEVDRGVLICGSGIGMAIAANKYAGVRATTAYDEFAAEMCRRHNDVNVLCLSSDRLGKSPVDNIVDIWLKTEFEAGRHARRVEKITEIEKREGCH